MQKNLNAPNAVYLDRARGRSGNPAAAAAQVRTAAAWCRCEERTDLAERRSACRRNIVSPDVSRYEAATSGGEALKRSARSPGGGAWRRSAGMRPDFLSFPEDGLGKPLHPYFLNGFSDDHVKRYKKCPIYWLNTSPKRTLQALIYLHRYNRDTVNRSKVERMNQQTRLGSDYETVFTHEDNNEQSEIWRSATC